MMAAVDEGVGQILDVLQRRGALDNTFIVFLSDNGYFFGEHGLGPERRFAYEEGIRSPFLVRFPAYVKSGSRRRELVICQDIAPTLLALAGGTPGPQIQGRSLLPLLEQRTERAAPGWRKSILVEYWAEQAMPWLVGMTYKAVRTDRYKYIHWVNRGVAGELDELGGLLPFVVLVQGDEPRAVLDAEAREQALRHPRVLRGDDGRLFEGIAQPRRGIAEIADGRRREDDHGSSFPHAVPSPARRHSDRVGERPVLGSDERLDGGEEPGDARQVRALLS
jgi:arylsulfatase A-like enzyme